MCYHFGCADRIGEMPLWPERSATGLCCIMSVFRSLIGQARCHWSKIDSESPLELGQKCANLQLKSRKVAGPGHRKTLSKTLKSKGYDVQSRKFLKVLIFKNTPILAVRVGLAKWRSGWLPLHPVSAGS